MSKDIRLGIQFRVPMLQCPHCKKRFAVMAILHHPSEESVYMKSEYSWMWQVDDNKKSKFFCYMCGKNMNTRLGIRKEE